MKDLWKRYYDKDGEVLGHNQCERSGIVFENLMLAYGVLSAETVLHCAAWVVPMHSSGAAARAWCCGGDVTFFFFAADTCQTTISRLRVGSKRK